MNLKLSRNPISNFYRGFVCPFQSFTFVRQHRNLHKFILIPFLINILTFSLVVYFGGEFFQEQVMTMMPQGEAWYWVILNYFVVLIAALLVLVMVFFTFTAVGCLIASPFNDLLSECTELLLTGHKDDNGRFSVFAFGRDAAQTMFVELKKISVFLLLCLVLQSCIAPRRTLNDLEKKADLYWFFSMFEQNYAPLNYKRVYGTSKNGGIVFIT